MGVTETLRISLTIFLSTGCLQKVPLFGVYDVRWPFLAEIHTAPLKRFVPSSVLQAVRALRNAPAALAVFLAGVAPVTWILGRSPHLLSTKWDISMSRTSAVVSAHTRTVVATRPDIFAGLNSCIHYCAVFRPAAKNWLLNGRVGQQWWEENPATSSRVGKGYLFPAK